MQEEHNPPERTSPTEASDSFLKRFAGPIGVAAGTTVIVWGVATGNPVPAAAIGGFLEGAGIAYGVLGS